MLNRNGHTADAFPDQCEVRGCTAPPREWFETSEFLLNVCSVHEFELRAGEPHAVVGKQVLVGRDYTNELFNVRHTALPARD